MKGGLGSASATLPDGTLVGALVAVNAIGDVRDPETQRILAGTRHPSGQGFLLDSVAVIAAPTEPGATSGPASDTAIPNMPPGNAPIANTTIAILATNALLTKTDANIIARMAHDGLALAIRPVHTAFDGDTIFVLGIGRPGPDDKGTAISPMELSMLGAAAVQTLARAVVKAIQAAESLHGVPAARDLASQGRSKNLTSGDRWGRLGWRNRTHFPVIQQTGSESGSRPPEPPNCSWISRLASREGPIRTSGRTWKRRLRS